jgi:hypothetical protein
MDPLTLTIFAGAGLKAYGSYMAGQASAAAARQQAKLKEMQANEMLSRLEIQTKRMSLQGDEFKANQTTDYASHGVALGTGATLVAMEDTNYKISQSIDDLRRDTIFKANQLKMGAGFDRAQASDSINAGAITAGGSLLEGASSYYKNVA